MADRAKKLEKLLADLKQRPRGVRFEEIEKLMELAGFVNRPTKGAHGLLFSHPVFVSLVVHVARPHDGKVKPFYVEDCFSTLDEMKYLEEKSDA